jgi:cyclophilin family peptidyl-prolyl cis-trans isomerase
MRLLTSLLLFCAITLPQAAIAAATDKLPDGLYAEFTTPHGAFVAELYARQVPMTVTNFVGLAEGTLGPKSDKPYYTGLKWYRVVPGFVIQSGNPKAPDDGDTGYTFADEFAPGLRHNEAGVLSMANGGPDTNSAEFFVTLGDCTRLNYLHSVFGRVVSGGNVLSQIKPDDSFSIKILRIGAEAKAFKADADTFHALVAKSVKYHGEPEPGPAANFDDPEKLLPGDPPRAKNFNFKLANFEHTTGTRIVARLFAKSPSATEDAKPGAFMHALATKLGVAQRGVLVAYFADEKDWRVWIGDDVTAVFLGHPASPADLAPEGPLHKIKDALLNAAQAEGDAAFATQQKNAAPDRPVAAAQQVKLQTDALLDLLILKLEPKPRQ